MSGLTFCLTESPKKQFYLQKKSSVACIAHSLNNLLYLHDIKKRYHLPCHEVGLSDITKILKVHFNELHISKNLLNKTNQKHERPSWRYIKDNPGSYLALITTATDKGHWVAIDTTRPSHVLIDSTVRFDSKYFTRPLKFSIKNWRALTEKLTDVPFVKVTLRKTLIQMKQCPFEEFPHKCGRKSWCTRMKSHCSQTKSSLSLLVPRPLYKIPKN
jgi:hypothetical protein